MIYDVRSSVETYLNTLSLKNGIATMDPSLKS